jgi:hypothetical protein
MLGSALQHFVTDLPNGTNAFLNKLHNTYALSVLEQNHLSFLARNLTQFHTSIFTRFEENLREHFIFPISDVTLSYLFKHESGTQD